MRYLLKVLNKPFIGVYDTEFPGRIRGFLADTRPPPLIPATLLIPATARPCAVSASEADLTPARQPTCTHELLKKCIHN